MNNIIANAQKHFPDLKIKYKNTSSFMKFIGTLLFFNKSFMTSYTTTLGSTIYFPSEEYTTSNPISFMSVFLHELVHIYDSKKKGKLLYTLEYAFPQILFLACIPLFFFFWKIALILSIIFLLPIPAYFRMNFEKRAYLCSLYSLSCLCKKYNISNSDIQGMLDYNKEYFYKEFAGPSYYFMWPFNSLKSDFDKGVNRIKAGLRPYDDEVFDMIDDLLSKV